MSIFRHINAGYFTNHLDIAMGISNELIVVRLGSPDLKTLLSVCIVFILAYAISKVLKALWYGLTGPLAKIPGPWLNRFTALPWMAAVVRGKAFEQGINYNRKYGDIVRVGELSFASLEHDDFC